MSDTSKPMDSSRREFLAKTSTAAGAAAVAPGVFLTAPAVAKPADQRVSSDKRWGILIDTAKCANGCTACVSACENENG